MRKRYALLVLTALAFAACSKSNTDVAPNDAGTQVAGVYNMTTLRFDSAGTSVYNFTLPISSSAGSLAGTITARRDSASVVYVTYSIKETGYPDVNDTFGQLKLKGTAAPYDLYYGANKVGTADGKTFTIDYSYTDNKGITYREVYAGKRQ